MKGIKKTLMAGLLTCAAFNAYEAKAEAELPALSYGITLSASASAAVGYGDDVKFDANNNKVENEYHGCIWFTPRLYVEYAFSDYIGMQFSAAYMKKGCSFIQGENKDKKNGDSNSDSNKGQSMAISQHGAEFTLYLTLYAFSRGTEEDNLKLSVGPSFYIPWATSLEKDGKEIENLNEKQKNEISKFNVGGSFNAEYEFDCGVSIVGQYGYNFINTFDIKENESQTIFNDVKELKTLHNHNLTIGVGYNLASLFAE